MKYACSIYQMQGEGNSFWIAESRELKGCIGQGETADKAIRELEENEKQWIDTALEVGIAVPEPVIHKPESYSGKFVVRVSPIVHKEASEQAKKQGISLNQYVNNAIITMNSSTMTLDIINGIISTREKRRYNLTSEPCTLSESGEIKYK